MPLAAVSFSRGNIPYLRAKKPKPAHTTSKISQPGSGLFTRFLLYPQLIRCGPVTSQIIYAELRSGNPVLYLSLSSSLTGP